MYSRLSDRSPDLKRLRDEGFDVSIRYGHLVLADVPYLNSTGQVKRGMLVSTLRTAGDQTLPPDTHVAMFVGEFPHDRNGKPLPLENSGGQQIGPDLVTNFTWSRKKYQDLRLQDYTDYYEKMTAYVNILEPHAQAVDATASARTFPVIDDVEDDSPFNYIDTASSRAGITALGQKLALASVGIVGLGGTGSYILDYVAKTTVREIHLYDDDPYCSHNSFRSPGAASIEELRAKPTKVDYWAARYSVLHRGIKAHPFRIDADNVAELQNHKFVFLCIDTDEKEHIVAALEGFGISFIDVGMGVELIDDDRLLGIVRATASTPENRAALRRRVALKGAGAPDDYRTNIQIADLNALNAALAVIKWKKFMGFYGDGWHEMHSTYTVNSHMLLGEETN